MKILARVFKSTSNLLTRFLLYTRNYISFVREYLAPYFLFCSRPICVGLLSSNHVRLDFRNNNSESYSSFLWKIGYFGKGVYSRGWPKYLLGAESIKPRETTLAKHDDEAVLLSLEEAFFLMHVLKCLKVFDENQTYLTENAFWSSCIQSQGDSNHPFQVRYAVYEYYRLQGWIVRGGSLYGADYGNVLYQKGPGKDHSKYCVMIATDETWENMTWTKLSGALRIAGTVQKALIVCHITRTLLTAVNDIPSRSDWTIKETVISRWIPERDRD